MESTATEIAVIFLLILANDFFAGSEISLVKVRIVKNEAIIDNDGQK